jgi:hypothetical protein
MAVTIPGLPAAVAAVLTDLIETSQGGVSKKETLQQVRDLFEAGGTFLLAANNLDDVQNTTTARDNLELGHGDVPQFNSLYLQSSGNPLLKLIDDEPFTTNGRMTIEFEQLNSASAGFDAVIVQALSTDVTAATEDSQLNISVMTNGASTACFALTGETLTLPSATLEKSAVAAEPFVNYKNSGTGTVNVRTQWQAKNASAAYFTVAQQLVRATSVVAGAEFGQIQIGVISSGVMVSDVLTLLPQGLQNTAIINYTDLTKLETSQNSLQIIGTQEETMPIVYAAGANGAQETTITFTNYAQLVRVFTTAVTRDLYIQMRMPTRWNLEEFQLILPWFTTATSGNVVWFVEAAYINSGDAMDVSFGTAVSVTSAANASANRRTDATTPIITPSGTAAANSIVLFRVYRVAGSGSDTLAENANLIPSPIIVWASDQGNDS